MKALVRDLAKPSFWQLVFLQSKVNGAAYRGEQLPRQNWDWPRIPICSSEYILQSGTKLWIKGVN